MIYFCLALFGVSATAVFVEQKESTSVMEDFMSNPESFNYAASLNEAYRFDLSLGTYLYG